MNKIAVALWIAGFGISSLIPVLGKELFSAKEVQDFTNSSRISSEGKNLLILRGQFLSSAKKIPYDPQKKYKLTCTAKLANGEKGMVYLGFIPYDAAGRRILSSEINAYPKTMTTLAADAEKGAMEICLADGSHWNNKTVYGNIAFQADEKLSDLPNRFLIPMAKGSVQKKDGSWTVKLKKPLNKRYEAGTAVRQHVDSDAYIYGARKNLTGAPQQLTAFFSGHATHGLSASKAWKGTSLVQVAIGLTSPDAAAVMELSELKLEELP